MTNREKNFVSAVVYIHNAGNRIEEYLRAILNVMERGFEHSEIICVNDSSDDDSVEKIKRISEEVCASSITVVNMSYFHGLEQSMNAGIDMAIGDFVFEFDNTILDFKPEIIIEVYRKLLQGFDIVSASADRKEKYTSKIFYKIFGKYTNLSSQMSTESFRILSRRVLNRVDSMNKTIPYRKVAYASCGLKIANIKYEVTTRLNEQTMDIKEKKYRTLLAVDSLILFTEVGYSFSKLMTVLMMVMSIFMVAYSVVVYTTANPVAGWTTTILFLSVAFFGLFGILTVVIKYLQLLVELVFKRKQYNYESVEKLTK